MKRVWYRRALRAVVLGLLFGPAAGSWAFDLVKDGQPVATIVVDEGPDAEAAGILVDWVQKMTGATLPTAAKPARGKPAVYVGAAAIAAGLKLDDIDSPSREGLRVRADKSRLWIAGQTTPATNRAVCRLLEEFGCRVFMDGEIGEVYPRQSTLTVGRLDITEQPGLGFRNPKGPNWHGRRLWKIWNGAGGTALSHAHAWGGYVRPSVFDEHPEFFAQRADGTRVAGGWLCTSNPALRKYFAEQVIAKIKGGDRNPSLSPTDGTGYCRCAACQAQDDPQSLEPSSGAVSMSNRYVDFFDDVARRVARECPDATLCFYCYADYTQPPTRREKLSPNLCAFIAPIRYCRLHAIGSQRCPQRVQQREMIDGWAGVADKLGYYMYLYDLAEATVPLSFVSRLKQDLPYLRERGCIGMTQEVLTNWHIYGPNIHLGLKLMYDPSADVDALMDDYCQKFYGPQAAPFMQQYWTAIDEAVAALDCHCGSFFWVHLVYTPEFLQRLRRLLDQAAAAAKPEPRYAERVALHTEGYRSAVEYTQLRAAIVRGDFARADKVYTAYLARLDGLAKRGWANPEYASAYMKRFNGPVVELGQQLLTPPNRLLAVLPDQWRMTYDPEQTGLEQKFAERDFDDAAWPVVATFSRPLSAQGLPDRTTVMWYRTTWDVPAQHGRLSLFFGEVDGTAQVYVNGRRVAGRADPEAKERPKNNSLAPVLRGEGWGEGRTGKCRSYFSAVPKPAGASVP
jgi:hypothetical protein